MEADGSVTVFAVNRDMEDAYTLELDLRSFGELSLAEHILMHHEDVKAVNTEEDPENVVPGKGPGGTIKDGAATVELPPLSWNVIRFVK